MLYDPWVRYEWEYSGALVRLFPGFMWRIRRVPITRIVIKPHTNFVKIWILLSSSNIVARKGYFWSSLHSGNVTHRSSSNPSSVESVFICLAANIRLPIYVPPRVLNWWYRNKNPKQTSHLIWESQMLLVPLPSYPACHIAMCHKIILPCASKLQSSNLPNCCCGLV